MSEKLDIDKLLREFFAEERKRRDKQEEILQNILKELKKKK